MPSQLFLIAAWFGLLTGLAEVFLLGVKKFIFHRMLFLGPHFVWMTPLADVLLFFVLGFVLWLSALCWPRLGSLRFATFVFAFISSWSLVLMYPGLHPYTRVLLAAGVATQAAYFIAVYDRFFRAVVRRTMIWMVVVVAALGAGAHGWDWFGSRRALANLPAAKAGAPNVLLIVLDTVRAQSLSVNGYTRATTPQLERLARTGVSFERAIVTAPWTTPSHASMFTGRFSHELSVIRAKFSPDGLTALDSAYPTLAEALSASGYLSAGFVANTEYCGYETGLNRGFAHYEDYQLSPVELALSSSVGRTVLNYWRLRRIFDYYDIAGRKTAQEVNNSFLRWLDRRRVQPFFAFLNYYDAHEPYRPPPPFDAQFGPNAPRENYPAVFGEGGIRQVKRGSRQLMSAPEIQAELDAYEGAIAYIDHHLGLLFDELQRRGLLENTLVIVTADHGEQFGEHGLFDHGNSLYLPLLHVPLVISFPTYVPAGAKISEPVSLRDLPATVLGLVGLGRVVSFPGASLARYWDDAPESKRSGSGPVFSEVTPFAGVPRRYPIARGDMSALVLDHYHYIKNGDGREELYDFAVDPAESHNLANSEESRQLLEQFRTRLKTTLAGNQLSSR